MANAQCYCCNDCHKKRCVIFHSLILFLSFSTLLLLAFTTWRLYNIQSSLNNETIPAILAHYCIYMNEHGHDINIGYNNTRMYDPDEIRTFYDELAVAAAAAAAITDRQPTNTSSFSCDPVTTTSQAPHLYTVSNVTTRVSTPLTSSTIGPEENE